MVPFLIVAVLFYYTAVMQTDVDKTSKQPGRHGRGHRVQVELAVHLPTTASGPRRRQPVYTVGSANEHPGAGRARSTRRSGSWRLATTSSTRSGCRSCCSSGTSSRRNEEPEQRVRDCGPRSRARYVGRCAELCGTYHSMMNFELRVVSPEKYRAVTCRRWPRSATRPRPAGQGAQRDRAAGRRRPPRTRSTPTGRCARRPSRRPTKLRRTGCSTECRLFAVLAGLPLRRRDRRTACGPYGRGRPGRGGRHHRAGPVRRCCALIVRQLLLVRLPPHRPAAGGPAGRRDRRGRRRDRLLQPGQLLAVRARAGRRDRRARPGVLASTGCSALGLIAVLFAAGGLLFEYYTRGHTSPTF